MLANLGGFWDALGASAEAATLYEQAIARFSRLDDAAGVATAEQNLERLRPARAELSRREHQVASLVVAGVSNWQIADELFISQRTVDSHLSHIFTQAGTHVADPGRHVWAVRQGLSTDATA